MSRVYCPTIKSRQMVICKRIQICTKSNRPFLRQKLLNTQHGVSCAPCNTIYHHFTIFATLRLPTSPINEGTTNFCIMFKIQFQNPSIASAMIVVHITRAGDWNTSLYSLYQFPYTCYLGKT